MLFVAILRLGQRAAVLELVGADGDACLVGPLRREWPSLTGAALPVAQLLEFTECTGHVHRHLSR